MATKKVTKRKKTKKQQAQQDHLVNLITGFIVVLLGLFGLFKLGFLGTAVANILRIVVGTMHPVLALILITYGIYMMVKGPRLIISNKKLMWGLILIFGAVVLMSHALLFRGKIATEPSIVKMTWELLVSDLKGNIISEPVGGGMVGAGLYKMSHFLVAQIGTYIVAMSVLAIGVAMAINVKWVQVVAWCQNIWGKLNHSFSVKNANRQVKKQERAEKREALELEQAQRELTAENQMKQKEQMTATDLPFTTLAEEEKVAALEIDTYQSQYDDKPVLSIVPDPITEIESIEEVEDDGIDLDFDIPQEVENRDYTLPPSTLLNDIPLTDQSDEYKSIEHNVGVLEQTFKSFGVDAKVVRASLGPSVTKYEIQPAVGVKVSKIVSLTDDLALALAAKDIRMEAPIPGKSLIGIEVPNNTVSMVSFRDIIEAQPKSADNLLEVPLGRDISGSVVSADLAKMPHMLIAGSTGSGKSVCINGIITSILMRAKPHEVKLMMIDPKMVELNVYNGIPHLLTPVVTNPRKAAQALHKVVKEMEERYEMFAASGVRNITGYNEMVAKHNEKDGMNKPILPFIVVIVDELADLMMVASNEVEDAIIRLAQMARAAGIHMILATQRPSVDVITGIIKANVPSRIAFAVSSGTDSRTIIDSNGAEKLLGRGDMLFLPMGQNKPTRVQGAFISDSEVEDLVGFVTDQQGADYREDMMPTDEPEKGASPDGTELDELFEEAVNCVVHEGKASASLLQRRFRIGYNRAARLVDQMEDMGVVGPSEGSKGRKILKSAVPDEETQPISNETESSDLPF